MRQGRTRIAVIAALFAISMGAISAGSSAAEAPYEPNDSLLSAAGPLLAGQTYTATIETAGDRDFFYFYATSAPESDVALDVTNQGGGSMFSDLDAAILNSSSTALYALAYIRDGETRTASLALEPQKYFVEIAANEGFGDTYTITPSGGNGGFAPYAQISSRCVAATDAVTIAETRLGRARARLQRAISRLRRARYETREAREKALSSYLKARSRVRSKKKALRAARAARRPWCFIPE